MESSNHNKLPSTLSHAGGEFSARVVILGEINAGKTTFTNAAAKGKFEDLGPSPKGISGEESREVRGEFKSGKQRKIKIRIRDTADVERFALLTKTHFQSISACIIMFDLTDKDWKEHVEKWREFFEENTAEANKTEFKRYIIELILVGNKNDLPNRAVAK